MKKAVIVLLLLLMSSNLFSNQENQENMGWINFIKWVTLENCRTMAWGGSVASGGLVLAGAVNIIAAGTNYYGITLLDGQNSSAISGIPIVGFATAVMLVWGVINCVGGTMLSIGSVLNAQALNRSAG